MTKRKNPDGSLSKTGPKTKWKMTQDVINKLEHAFAIDANIVQACAYADISTETYYQWIRAKPELADRFERLKQHPILKAKNTVNKGLSHDHEFALKWLKARFPKEFCTTDEDGSSKINLNIAIVNLIEDVEKNVTLPDKQNSR